MDRIEMLSAELQIRGQKLTKQRLAILKVLNESQLPLTAEEIFLSVREGKANTSLATVYRNLKSLAAADLVVKSGLLEDKVQYRLQSDSHSHSHNLVCLGCKKVIQLARCPLDCLTESIGQKEGFTVTEHHMELYGYCLDCGKIDRRLLPNNTDKK